MSERSELAGFTVVPEPELMFDGNGSDKHPLRGVDQAWALWPQIRIAQQA